MITTREETSYSSPTNMTRLEGPDREDVACIMLVSMMGLVVPKDKRKAG